MLAASLCIATCGIISVNATPDYSYGLSEVEQNKRDLPIYVEKLLTAWINTCKKIDQKCDEYYKEVKNVIRMHSKIIKDYSNNMLNGVVRYINVAHEGSCYVGSIDVHRILLKQDIENLYQKSKVLLSEDEYKELIAIIDTMPSYDPNHD
ncbi:MAG: hypothetical protein IJ848_02565 [Alphaproteobacteria bacterium]|nr:hypothetical protein [Alphaproteobacteria bacterium]